MNESTKLGCSQTIIWGRCSVGALAEHPIESGGSYQCLKLAVCCWKVSSAQGVETSTHSALKTQDRDVGLC